MPNEEVDSTSEVYTFAEAVSFSLKETYRICKEKGEDFFNDELE